MSNASVYAFNKATADYVLKGAREALAADYGGGVERIIGSSRQIVLARLTAQDATHNYLYAWEHRFPNVQTSVTAAFTNGLTGTTALRYAVDATFRPTSGLVGRDVVLARVGGRDDAGKKGPIWIIAAVIGGWRPLPTGLYQVLQCTAYTSATNFTEGYDWVRCHA